jgi:hypothetical protein
VATLSGKIAYSVGPLKLFEITSLASNGWSRSANWKDRERISLDLF